MPQAKQNDFFRIEILEEIMTTQDNISENGMYEQTRERLDETAEKSNEARAKIQEGVTELAGHAAETIRLGKTLGKEKMDEGIEKAKLYGQDSLVSLRERVAEQPIKSLGIAAGAGALLGLLLSSRKKKAS
jgi:ElaB/YqjD/DUF883 family membrane-anchored ribosome-binding protein